MGNYISRDKAVKVIDALDDISDAWGCAIPMHTIKEKIKEIPSANVVEVVRCRDCKHFQQFRAHDGFCQIDGMLWNNDFFCANGAKMEES